MYSVALQVYVPWFSVVVLLLLIDAAAVAM